MRPHDGSSIMQHTPDPLASSRMSSGLMEVGRPATVLLVAILSLGLVRAGFAALIGLTEDEAYYRLWALALAIGYLDHPPMVGWMIAFGRWVGGDTAFGIRFPAILISLLGPLVLWRTAAVLFGPIAARRAVWIALAMPLLAVGGVLMTPDTPSVLFWGLSAWALAELHISRNANWWLAVGTFAGLGLLSKYSNAFVGASIVLWLSLFRANRPWFRCWQLWAGGVIAILLALPVVLWNYQHDWVSFAKQFGRVGHGHGLTMVYLAELMGGSAALMGPVVAVLAVLGFKKAGSEASADPPSALLVAGMLPFLGYLIVHSLHDRVQANWMAPLYPSFAVCAALALGAFDTTAKPDRTFGRLGHWALGMGFVLCGLIYWHTLRPLVQLAGQKDPTSQTRGWRQLAAEVERLRAATGACWI